MKDFKEHPHNSYLPIVINKSPFTDTKKVLDFFRGFEAFKSIHKNPVDYYYSNNWPSSKLE